MPDSRGHFIQHVFVVRHQQQCTVYFCSAIFRALIASRSSCLWARPGPGNSVLNHQAAEISRARSPRTVRRWASARSLSAEEHSVPAVPGSLLRRLRVELPEPLHRRMPCFCQCVADPAEIANRDFMAPDDIPGSIGNCRSAWPINSPALWISDFSMVVLPAPCGLSTLSFRPALCSLKNAG